ncbi:MAG: PCP reductase family protein [Candidatus Rokubacteria bacterium]|nr:PCP reductase family protein [Candidatus Rokubacteria bacterium]
MVNEGTAPPASGLPWTPEAEARIERIPEFIRSMARRAIERYAEGKGCAAITEAVMDEARGAFGM